MAAPRVSESPDPSAVDHFVYLRNVTWREYEALLAMRGERSVPRITYLCGVLELMSPSRYHESDKKKLARLLEAWGEEKGIVLEGIGSWTLKNSKEERGAEPDECYTVGRVARSDDDRPDIAIEVIWTSGGINKLEVYRKLGVREVWIYERETLRFFLLRDDQYEGALRSELLPDVDPELFTRCMREATQGDAVRAMRAALRG
ncbi:MAG TPA: Uma2 family endonuclease [Polyangiaceae bacterium]